MDVEDSLKAHEKMLQITSGASPPDHRRLISLFVSFVIQLENNQA